LQWTLHLSKAAEKQRRFVAERTFGTLKRTYSMGKARYISLAKVAQEVNLKAIAYNLTRAANVYKNMMTKTGWLCIFDKKPPKKTKINN
jgi:hypothetical protein